MGGGTVHGLSGIDLETITVAKLQRHGNKERKRGRRRETLNMRGCGREEERRAAAEETEVTERAACRQCREKDGLL